MKLQRLCIYFYMYNILSYQQALKLRKFKLQIIRSVRKYTKFMKHCYNLIYISDNGLFMLKSILLSIMCIMCNMYKYTVNVNNFHIIM